MQIVGYNSLSIHMTESASIPIFHTDKMKGH